MPRDPRLAESMAAVGRFDALLGRFVVAVRVARDPEQARMLLEQAADELAKVLPEHRGGRARRLAQAQGQLARRKTQPRSR